MKTFQALVRVLLSIDDCDLVTHIQEEMQMLMDGLSQACQAFDLNVSLDKTIVIFQLALDQLQGCLHGQYHH